MDELPPFDRRVAFIHSAVEALNTQLESSSRPGATGLLTRYGHARQEIPKLIADLRLEGQIVNAVFVAHDYEPQALERDSYVQNQLASMGVAWHSEKDTVIFERREVLTQTGKPYGVFTPYKNAWLARLALHPYEITSALSLDVIAHLAPRPAAYAEGVPRLAAMGFESVDLPAMGIKTGEVGAQQLLLDFVDRMDAYEDRRNFPSVKGPSYLSVHLRFGTVAIRELVRLALPRFQAGSAGAGVWLSELIWRDFYFQILANFPQVATGAFKPEYDAIAWETGPTAQAHYAAWCEGKTGYPLVDAAMAQLNQSGYMHNRLRMVAGSFLVKHLGLDWRWGERYFAKQLIDFDLSANNGGWQWVASSGCDAQPYFRIFNPISQSEKFDAEGKFIKRYLPQLAHLSAKHIHAPWLQGTVPDYPGPIVDHASARQATLTRYAVVKKS